MANDKVRVQTSKLTALADAIRAKSGDSAEITINDIPTIIPSLSAPPRWADGTWDEIAKALADHKAGKIDLYTTPGWGIGATRVVPLAAMSATLDASESHVAQDVEIVLADKDVYDLEDGSGKCVFTWELKNCLANGTTAENGTMNTNSNIPTWSSSERRTWCNDTFKAALPSEFRNLIPFVKVGGTEGYVTDYCFLRSEVEVTGMASASSGGDSSGIFIKYHYSNTNARKKKAGKNGSATAWWFRSSSKTNPGQFCLYNPQFGNIVPANPTIKLGVSPCGCI